MCWRAPGFLKLLVREVSMCVCVPAPQAMQNPSCEMKPEVLLVLYGTCVALVMAKCVVSYCQKAR